VSHSPIKFRFDPKQLDSMRARLEFLDETLSVKVGRKSQRKAIKIFADRLKALTPKQRKKPKGVKDLRHMRDTVAVKQKTYRNGKRSTTVTIAGFASPQVKHAHLVEHGTDERFTKHTTRYNRVPGRKRIKLKRGGWGYRRTRKISIGSFRDPRKTGMVRYTGRMRAYRPTQRAFDQTESAMTQSIYQDLRAAISDFRTGK
jgi:hypothetical protein